MPADPRDGDDAVLERLAQRLEHRARELGQLVEQEHAAVRERHLARARARAAADDSRSRGAVVRRAERRHGDERAPGREEPATEWMRVTSSASCPGQRRKDPRQAPREHRLARARRAGEQQVVRARSGDLEGAASPLLPADVGEVRHRASRLERLVGERLEPGASISPRR